MSRSRWLVVCVFVTVLAVGVGALAAPSRRTSTRAKPGPSDNAKPHCVLEPGGEPTCPLCYVFDYHICKCVKVPACKV